MTDTALALPVKEVERTNKEVMNLQEQANDLIVKTPDDMSAAATLLESIKGAEKMVTGRKEEITRPLMRSLASIRDLFKPIELTLENAKKVAKAKVLAFQTAEEARIATEKAKIEKRLEKGTMRLDTALEKMENIGEVPRKSGSMKTRTITKVRIVDETLIPREFLIPDLGKITEAVLKAKLEVPGVEKYQERIIAV